MDGIKQEVINNLFKLLRYELSGDTSCAQNFKLSETDLYDLFSFSKFYDLAHLIGDALNKNGLLPDGAEIKSKFLSEIYMAVMRNEKRAYEYAKICESLSKEKIPFIPLKGAIIKDLYPQPWMRTSSDIDILIKSKDLSLAIEVLKTDLNYAYKLTSAHDAQLSSPSGVSIELHFTLTGGDTTGVQKQAFESVWAFDENSERYERKMSQEHFYGYFVLHTAIHFKEGGCGIRPLIDLFLMQQKWGYNNESCKNFLKEIGLFTFNEKITKLSNVWFSNEKYSAFDKELEKYILAGGLYGTTKNRVLVKTEEKGKLRYVLSRIFIPYSKLKITYPRLRKCPILLPYYEVKRWFNLLNKNKRKEAKSELKTTINTTNESGEKINKLLNELGI